LPWYIQDYCLKDVRIYLSLLSVSTYCVPKMQYNIYLFLSFLVFSYFLLLTVGITSLGLCLVLISSSVVLVFILGLSLDLKSLILSLGFAVVDVTGMK